LEIHRIKFTTSVECENIYIYVIDVDVNTVYHAIHYDEDNNPTKVLLFVPQHIWKKHGDGVIVLGRNLLQETLSEYEVRKLNELLKNVDIIDVWEIEEMYIEYLRNNINKVILYGKEIHEYPNYELHMEILEIQ